MFIAHVAWDFGMADRDAAVALVLIVNGFPKVQQPTRGASGDERVVKRAVALFPIVETYTGHSGAARFRFGQMVMRGHHARLPSIVPAGDALFDCLDLQKDPNARNV